MDNFCERLDLTDFVQICSAEVLPLAVGDFRIDSLLLIIGFASCRNTIQSSLVVGRDIYAA